MKKTRVLILTTMLCALSFSVEAQFLKNLKNQVIERSKEAIIDKTANKVAESVSEKVSDQIAGSINKALGESWGELMGPIGSIKDIETLPASYSFDYIYSLKISTTEGELPIDYYLSKSKPYMGAKFNLANDMTMIFDDENKALITFIGDKAIATELKIDDIDINPEEHKADNYKISNLPNKTFLGYNCIGRLIENDEYKMTVYLAENTEASFANMFNSRHAKLPKQMKTASGNAKDGMLMYAEVTDKTRNNANSTMECTAFEKSDKVIKTR